jgi:hypothetical protein
MVPDVAADADPDTGYEIILYGASTVIGGTSAVAPLYAGLFASFGTKLGFVTPTLYLNSACFTDITHGNNGAFRGRTGADPCTGLGSPIGATLEERIQPATLYASRIRDLIAENAQLRAAGDERGTIPRSYSHAKSLGFQKSAIGYNDLPDHLRSSFIQMSDVGSGDGSVCGIAPSPNQGYMLVCYKSSSGQCNWVEVPKGTPPAAHG